MHDSCAALRRRRALPEDDLDRHGDPTGAQLWTDRDLRPIIEGVLAAELPHRLAPSAGLRNLLTHGYGPIDHDLVAAAVDRARTDLRADVEAVAQQLAKQEGSGPGGR